MSPRELSKEIQRSAKLVLDLETEVAAAESALKGLEHALAAPPEGTDLHKLTREFEQAQGKVSRAFEAWEKESHRLEELKAMQG